VGGADVAEVQRSGDPYEDLRIRCHPDAHATELGRSTGAKAQARSPVAEREPPARFFRGIGLRGVLLPTKSTPGTGVVLALEHYSDGLIVRSVIQHTEVLTNERRGKWLDEARFEVTDDLVTSYRWAGAVGGGAPALHILSMFTPAPPTTASWLRVVSPLGDAHFEL
jgi:hypothetical protein